MSDHLSTWERIRDAANLSGWRVVSSTGDSITYARGIDWLAIWWTHPATVPVTVLRAVAFTHGEDGDSVVEHIHGKGKADRVESILWSHTGIAPRFDTEAEGDDHRFVGYFDTNYGRTECRYCPRPENEHPTLPTQKD